MQTKKKPSSDRRTGKPLLKFPEIKPPADQVLKTAFMDHKKWIRFFNKLNTLFPKSLLLTIHEAKTISAGAAILETAESFSCSIEALYPLACRVFDRPAQLRLCNLIDLYNQQSFVESMEKLNRRFLSKPENQPNPIEKIDYAIGTLPLFGMETFCFKKISAA